MECLNCFLYGAADLAVGPNDQLYISEMDGNKIRVIDTSGNISTFAGTGTVGPLNDGGPAINASLRAPQQIAVGQDGRLYIADQGETVIRVTDNQGIIQTLAGRVCTNCPPENRAEAITTDIFMLYGLAVDPNNEVYFPHSMAFLAKVSSGGVKKNSDGSLTIAAEGGKVVYTFNEFGQHITTHDTVHGAILYRFIHDSDGKLSRIIDRNGLETSLMRDGSGQIISIIGPYGETTHLSYQNELLTSVVDPAARETRFEYESGSLSGLLKRMISPKGLATTFSYDAKGLLIADEDPTGGRKTLTGTDLSNGRRVEFKTPMGRMTEYQSVILRDGSIEQSNRHPDGTVSFNKTTKNRDTLIESPDGMSSRWTSQADPRFGLAAAIPLTSEITTPSGLTSQKTFTRSVTLSNSADFMSLNRLEEKTLIQGVGEQKSVFDKSNRSQTVISPSGFVSRTFYDDKGRIIRSETPSITPVESIYDSLGRLTTLRQGDRSTTFTYDTLGRLASTTNALNETVSYTLDAAGRVIQITYPDQRKISYQYDRHDNVTKISPPKAQAHTFAFDDNDLLVLNVEPEVGQQASSWTWAYNPDYQPTLANLPNGRLISFNYDGAGRAISQETAEGDYTATFESSTGLLSSRTTPEGNLLSFAWDGRLPKRVDWTGEINGRVSFQWGNPLRLYGETVDGADPITYEYTPEGLVSQAGDLSLSYDSMNGALKRTVMQESRRKMRHYQSATSMTTLVFLGKLLIRRV